VSKILLNGVGLNYRRVGEGPDIILVHGLAANLAFWRLAALRELSSRFRVTAYDLRGHGYSDMPPSGYTDGELAADLAALVNALGIGRAHVVGHSFGGSIALRFALDNPTRVASLSLVDTRIPGLQPTLRKSEFPHWELWRERFREAGFDVEDEEDLDFEILEAFDDPRWRDLRLRLGAERFFVPFEGPNRGERGIRRWRDLLATTTARADLRGYRGPGEAAAAALRFPVLAFYGEYSHCLASGHAIVERAPGCRFEMCREGGHFFPFVHPMRFAETVRAFIEGVERSMVEARTGWGVSDAAPAPLRASLTTGEPSRGSRGPAAPASGHLDPLPPAGPSVQG